MKVRKCCNANVEMSQFRRRAVAHVDPPETEPPNPPGKPVGPACSGADADPVPWEDRDPYFFFNWSELDINKKSANPI